MAEPTQLLTSAEHEAIDLAGQLANRMRRIVGEGPTREGDWAEVVYHVHGIQRMVMSQAAARAYPELYRTLGEAASDG